MGHTIGEDPVSPVTANTRLIRVKHTIDIYQDQRGKLLHASTVRGRPNTGHLYACLRCHRPGKPGAWPTPSTSCRAARTRDEKASLLTLACASIRQLLRQVREPSEPAAHRGPITSDIPDLVRRFQENGLARRRAGHWPEEPRGPAPALPAGEPRLGVREPELPAAPPARWPDHVIDVKKVIAWLREHGPEHGADPDRIFLAGGSSGAPLAAVAALTPSDPRFQPDFEDADASVCAVIALYGHYRWCDAGPGTAPSSPLAYLQADAPPFLVAHGDRDTLLPASAAGQFAAALRERSRSPVVYAEPPGAQHQFDLFHSVPCTAVVNGIEAFAAWVLRCRPTSCSQSST